ARGSGLGGWRKSAALSAAARPAHRLLACRARRGVRTPVDCHPGPRADVRARPVLAAAALAVCPRGGGVPPGERVRTGRRVQLLPAVPPGLCRSPARRAVAPGAARPAPYRVPLAISSTSVTPTTRSLCTPAARCCASNTVPRYD